MTREPDPSDGNRRTKESAKPWQVGLTAIAVLAALVMTILAPSESGPDTEKVVPNTAPPVRTE